MSIGVILADDQPIVLDGLEKLLGSEKDMKILARCQNGEETVRAVRTHRPDVLVLGIRMAGMDGLAVLRELKKDRLPTRLVLLTAAIDENEVLEAVRLGVHGVVLKEMASQLIVQCIRKVHRGEQWLEKRSVARAVEMLLQREAGLREIGDLLTARELELVRLVASGLRNKLIADKLSISEGTVKVHLHHIYEKLGVDSRVALTLLAQRKGLV
jgi:DNA-binding NarL/FixJ family response regulator